MSLYKLLQVPGLSGQEDPRNGGRDRGDDNWQVLHEGEFVYMRVRRISIQVL